MDGLGDQWRTSIYDPLVVVYQDDPVLQEDTVAVRRGGSAELAAQGLDVAPFHLMPGAVVIVRPHHQLLADLLLDLVPVPKAIRIKGEDHIGDGGHCLLAAVLRPAGQEYGLAVLPALGEDVPYQAGYFPHVDDGGVIAASLVEGLPLIGSSAVAGRKEVGAVRVVEHHAVEVNQ